jgi:hypothetical protein
MTSRGGIGHLGLGEIEVEVEFARRVGAVILHNILHGPLAG